MPVIGHLHNGVILLLRPESFSFFLSYLNFVIPVRFGLFAPELVKTGTREDQNVTKM